MNRRRSSAAALGIFAVALALGVFRIGRNSLWDDEGFSVAAAHLHLVNVLSFTKDRDPHTGLFHMLLHYWIAINGDGEAWIRFLSALCAAGAAVALWFTLRRLFSMAIASASTALFVVNGFYLEYAQEARPYALALLFTCLAMAAFVAAVQTGRRSFWWGWVFASALAVYAHPFALFTVVSAHLSLLAAPHRPRARLWIGLGCAQIALCAPLMWLLHSQTVPHLNWVPALSVASLGGAAVHLTGHGGYGMTLLVMVLIAVVLFRTVRQLVKREGAWPQTLVLLWALLLPAALLAASLVKHVLVSRYLIPALPGVMTAVVLSISSLKQREYKFGATALIAVFALVSVNTYFRHGAKDDWRDAAAYVAENAQPGDAIVISYDQRNVFQYYYQRNGAHDASSPTPLSPERPWGSRIPISENRIDTSSPGAVAKAVAPFNRVWELYLNEEPRNASLQTGLAGVFSGSHTERFAPRVQATLFSNQ